MGTDTETTAAPLEVRYAQGENRVTATVEIAGHDLTKTLSRISFDHSGGDLPKVYLELRKGAELPEILVDAVVYLRETILEDPADAMLRFIEPLDPGEFEKACLAAMELGGPTTFGEAALYVLKGYAGGDDERT